MEYAEPARYKDLHRWVNDTSEVNNGLARLESTARRSLGLIEPDASETTPTEADENEAVPSLSRETSPDTARGRDHASEPTSRTDGSREGTEKSKSRAAPASSRAGTASSPARDSSSLRSVDAPSDERDEAKLPADAHLWTESAWQMEWLALDPPLSGVDLAPYFELGRAALPSLAVRARALPERLQRLLQHMASNASEVRDKAADQAAALDAVEASQLTDAALDRLATEKNPGNLIQALATVAASHPPLASGLLRAIRSVPFDALTVGLPQSLPRRLKDAGAPADIDDVLRLWATQTTNARLARAAGQALEKRA